MHTENLKLLEKYYLVLKNIFNDNLCSLRKLYSWSLSTDLFCFSEIPPKEFIEENKDFFIFKNSIIISIQDLIVNNDSVLTELDKLLALMPDDYFNNHDVFIKILKENYAILVEDIRRTITIYPVTL